MNFNIRMITVFTVMICLLFSVVAFAVPEDVKGTDFEKPVQVLEALGVVTVGEDGFKPADTMTRAEFSVIITKLLGMGEQALAATPEQIFKDVPADHSEASYISIVSGLGLINGYEDGEFKPNNIVTYGQALKVIVSILGYNETAINRGGYPTGYLTVATDKKITKGISTDINGDIKKGEIAKLLYNSLEVDILEQIGFSDDKQSYTVAKGENILKRSFNVYKKTGIIVANQRIKLYPSTNNIREDEVQIGGFIYKVGTTNAENLLGHTVVFYSKLDDQTKDSTLLLLSLDKDKDKFVEVSSVDLDSVENLRTSKALVKYLDKKKDEIVDLKILMYATIVYNGKLLSEGNITSELIENVSGKLTFFDTDNDNVYDLIYIMDYNSFVVDSVNTINETIYMKYSEPNLSLAGTNVEYSVYRDGVAIELKSIKASDVVNVAKSIDGNLVTIDIYSLNKIKGIVTEKTYDSKDKEKVTIEGESYGIAKSNTASVNVDDQGVFYLNSNKEIIVYDNSSAVLNYAYLLQAGVRGSGLSGVGQLKVIDIGGKVVTYDMLDKMNVNGLSNQSYSYALSKLQTDGTTTKQPIIIELNADKKVSEIHTKESANAYYKDALTSFTDTVAMKATAGLIYRPGPGSFKGTCLVNKNTIVIGIPGDVEEFTEYFFKKDAASYFGGFGDNKYYNFVTYGENEVGLAKLIVLKLDSSNAGAYETTNILLVDSISTTVDKYGDVVSKIYGIYKGSKYSKSIKNTTDLKTAVSKIRRGDVLQISETSTGIEGIRLIFTQYTDPKTGFLLKKSDSTKVLLGAEGDDKEIAYGTIVGKVDEFIKVKCSDTIKRIFKLPTTVYKYVSSENKIYKAQPSELQVGATIVYKATYDGMQDVYLFE